MHHIPRLSEAVYVGMCRYVGSPTEVRIRREVTDIDEVVCRPVMIMKVFDRMKSGSRREGFRFKTSDMDFMFWLPDHKVICDLSQISLYRIPQHTMILMECENLPLGFTRLKLMTPSPDQKVNSSLIASNNEIYISSFLYRAQMLEYQQALGGILGSSIQHGPCATVNHDGYEADYAYCFRSHHWPNVALPWIQRCQIKNWPLDYVLSSIIKNGCHVVPISSSPLNSESGCEWRISFSGAEQKLVSSMNHCQITEEMSNKKRAYICDKSLKMMNLASKIGCASEIFYLAMLYYKTCQYEQSLRCLQRAQDKMSKPYVTYYGQVNKEMYRRAMAGVSLSDRIRKCLICDILFDYQYINIDELVPEQEANKADRFGTLRIPPLVMLNMLFVLTHHRLGDTVRSQQSLQDLHTLLLYDDGTHVLELFRDISWQILGICQQTCGDYIGALISFQCSLQQTPWHAIQKVTMFRIQGINDFLLQTLE
ncbi:uncharacterized protein LOC111099655 [Crassostrea virginica]